MRKLRLTEVGKLSQVHTVNEFGFEPLLLAVMLCDPLAVCDSRMKRLCIWKTVAGRKYGGRWERQDCVCGVGSEGRILLSEADSSVEGLKGK